MTRDRDDLHDLVDRLPPEETEAARRLLRQLVRSPSGRTPAAGGERGRGRGGSRGRSGGGDVDLEALLDETDPIFEDLEDFVEETRAGYNPT